MKEFFRVTFGLLIVANIIVCYQVWGTEPTQFSAQTEDGYYIHINAILGRAYLTTDEPGLHVIRRANDCGVKVFDSQVIAIKDGVPIAIVNRELHKAAYLPSWKVNVKSRKKLI